MRKRTLGGLIAGCAAIGVVGVSSADFTSASFRAAGFQSADGEIKGIALTTSQRMLVEEAIQALDDSATATTQECVDCLRKMLANNRICAEDGTDASGAITLPDMKAGCNPGTEGIHLSKWAFRQTKEVLACVLAHEWFHTNQSAADYVGGNYELPAYQQEKSCLAALGQTTTPRYMIICDQVTALQLPPQTPPNDPARTSNGGKLITTDDGWSYSFHSDFSGVYILWADNSTFWGHLHDVPSPMDASVYEFDGDKFLMMLGYDNDAEFGIIETLRIDNGGASIVPVLQIDLPNFEPFSNAIVPSGERLYVLDTNEDKIVGFDQDGNGLYSIEAGTYADVMSFPEMAGALWVRINTFEKQRGVTGDSLIVGYRDTRLDSAIVLDHAVSVLYDDDNDGVADRIRTLDNDGLALDVRDFVAVVPGFVDEPSAGQMSVDVFAGAGVNIEIQVVDSMGALVEVLGSGVMPADSNEASFALSRAFAPCEIVQAVDIDNLLAVPPNPFFVPNIADLAVPFGVLNFDDVLAFLVAFGGMQPAADLAEPIGVFDFDDVLAFLVAFGMGCS